MGIESNCSPIPISVFNFLSISYLTAFLFFLLRCLYSELCFKMNLHATVLLPELGAEQPKWVCWMDG